MINHNQLAYFAPLLPWQQDLWQRLTTQEALPHAMLASGRLGIGKRAFVWRWVAWQLCSEPSPQGACGHCESCQLLISGTHTDLYVLPRFVMPKHSSDYNAPSEEKSDKKAQKDTSVTIKIDDIRQMQNFVNRSSQNVRICVLDYAEKMTLSAANALLKTLEEPRSGVQLILISDNPHVLIPTIKSRVQTLPLARIEHHVAYDYVKDTITQSTCNSHKAIEQLLVLSDYAPLEAVNIAKSQWYAQRNVWLKTWNALQNKSRTATSASDYWQNQLSLAEFIQLTQVMLVDLQRLACELPPRQHDIDFTTIAPQNFPDISYISSLLATLQKIDESCKQNVQDKLAYDMLIETFINI